MNEKIEEYDDEIELMDLLRVIWRWKVFIISVLVLSSISALIYVSSVPNIYKCSMLIKPAVLKQKGLSKKRTIVSSTDISVAITSKALTEKIIKALKLSKKNLYKGALSFNVTSVKKTDNIKVVYHCYKPDQGVTTLNILVDFLNNHFQPEIVFFIEQENLKISKINIKINNHKNQLKRSLSDKNDQIDYILSEMEYHEKKKVNSEKEAEKSKERIKTMKMQKDSIVKKYNALIGQSKSTYLDKKNISNNMLYFNTIFLLESRLDRIQRAEYDLQMFLLRKQDEIDKNFISCNNLSVKKRSIQEKYLINKEKIDFLISGLENDKFLRQRDINKNKFAVQTIKPPVSLSNAVKPNKKLIIFLTSISSFFVSIFCAFIFEYFRNYNKGMGKNN